MKGRRFQRSRNSWIPREKRDAGAITAWNSSPSLTKVTTVVAFVSSVDIGHPLAYSELEACRRCAETVIVAGTE
jgi:hypothetical protein